MGKAMEVIEFQDNSGDIMVNRSPFNEIKWGAQLTVRESQEAVFFRDGKALDVFKAGRHILKTQNIPIIGKWVTSFGYGPESPFRSEVYFLSKQVFTNLKWGTSEPILFRDSELKMIRIRSFGMFSIQISDSMLFLNKVVGTRGAYKNDSIQDYLKNIIVSRLTNILGIELKTVFDMPKSFDDLSVIMRSKLISDFEGLGLSIHDFHINSISLPEEVQKIIDQKSGMTAIGNMDDFMKYKIALSLENASLQEGSGETMSNALNGGMGMGMGFMMPQMIQQSMSSTLKNDDSQESPMDRLKKLKELLDLGAISEEEFIEKKKHLMNQI
jgi:membrane protease subunit (stomatin/prohibitin family)